MLQQPEGFKGQQKSPDMSAVGEGEGAALQTSEGSSWQAAEAVRFSPCCHQGKGQDTGNMSQDVEKGTGRDNSNPLPVSNTQRGVECNV